MEYKIEIPEFEGPLDLLLHLIKQDNIDIYDISIDKITKQYLEYIQMMDSMNLNIASEYLVMAAELIEMKSSSLLPHEEEVVDEYEEDPKEQLIRRLVEYERYKNMTDTFKELESIRSEVYTKTADDLYEYMDPDKKIDYGVDLNDLMEALSKFLEEKEIQKPLNTKVTNKEYSVGKRSVEIRDILRTKKKVNFTELFQDKTLTKEYVIVTFLAILSMSKKQEIFITQDNNFKDIVIKEKGAKE